MTGLTIGKVAKGAGLGIETVRFYEREGLIEPPARTESNYRIYPKQDIVRLRFIKRAKNLGFALSEIRELLSFRHDPLASKEDVKRQVGVKIEEITQKINDLTRIKQTLEALDKSCDGLGPSSECPILDALECGQGLDDG
jgi:Cu(I)-responsive transcriptional regulator